MDDSKIADYEQRAAAAEHRLAALESKSASGGAGRSAGLVERYVYELGVLREVLVAAKLEQESVEKRLAEAEADNSKLRYQIAHLKRAVKECDEKLASKS